MRLRLPLWRPQLRVITAVHTTAETEARVHVAILSGDDAQVRVLTGAAERQGLSVTALRPDEVEALVGLAPDAVIVDEVRGSAASTDTEACLAVIRRALPGVHLFLLEEPPPEEDRDVALEDRGAAPTEVSALDRAASTGVCLVQRKPFHPAEFFRVLVHTIAQEDAGVRACPTETPRGDDRP